MNLAYLKQSNYYRLTNPHFTNISFNSDIISLLAGPDLLPAFIVIFGGGGGGFRESRVRKLCLATNWGAIGGVAFWEVADNDAFTDFIFFAVILSLSVFSFSIASGGIIDFNRLGGSCSPF